MPLISVIMPVYNGEVTVRETIESVLNQTFSDYEFLIINDGSQDATLEVLNSIQDSRIKIFSYPNSGVSSSRNRGIDLAKGEYVAFIDADDLWTPDKLEAQLQALKSNLQAAVAYSWTDWIDQAGQLLRPGGHILAEGNVYTTLLLRDFIESGSNPLIRKSALSEVGSFDPSLSHAEDWDLWLRLAAHYEFVAVPFVQVLYRVADSSASTNVWKMEAASIQVIERAIEFASQSLSIISCKQLRKEAKANRYQYLTLKALEPPLRRGKALVAIRFFKQAISYDSAWLQKRKLILIILLKISIAALLPSQIAIKLLSTLKNLSLKLTQKIQT